MSDSQPYLSICSMYRDLAEYLPEWIEFHRLVGAERFFLYDNESTDSCLDVLAPYIDQGIVEVRYWPGAPFYRAKRNPGELPFAKQPAPFGLGAAFDDCLRRHRHDSRWIAFLDIDEFFFSPGGLSLSEVLADFEAWPGVAVSRLNFGTSGHRHKPRGLVIENYLHRESYESCPPGHKSLVKSVVDPARTLRCLSVHRFLHESGSTVDEKGRPLDDSVNASEISLSKLRINHYWMKSEEEFEAKQARWEAANSDRYPRPRLDPALHEYFEGEYDDEITSHVPALKERLARVQA
jgi:hypothetical protein